VTIKKGEMGRVCIHSFGQKMMVRVYHSEDLGIDEMIIVEWILGKYGEKIWTGCIWFRIESSDEFL
jgi:hypothetical protein